MRLAHVIGVVLGVAASILWAGAIVSGQGSVSGTGGWSYFGGTSAFMRYAPLGEIDRDNVTDLEILWELGEGENTKMCEFRWVFGKTFFF